jgi:hypothetical protein
MSTAKFCVTDHLYKNLIIWDLIDKWGRRDPTDLYGRRGPCQASFLIEMVQRVQATPWFSVPGNDLLWAQSR